MRRLFTPLLAASVALAACVALARAATEYNGSVTGSQTAAAEGVSLNLNATGDLPGMLTLSLKHESGRVTGGTWSLTVLPPDADATSTEKGRLSGVVGGGTLTLDGNGIVSAAEGLRLIVQGGDGQYAGVSGGGATLSLSADPENASKLAGPLKFDF